MTNIDDEQATAAQLNPYATYNTGAVTDSPSAITPTASVPSGELGAALWAVTAAFGCYFCFYAFRKPFTAATFGGPDVWGLSFKTLLLTSQVAGYAGAFWTTATPRECIVFVSKRIVAGHGVRFKREFLGWGSPLQRPSSVDRGPETEM